MAEKSSRGARTGGCTKPVAPKPAALSVVAAPKPTVPKPAAPKPAPPKQAQPVEAAGRSASAPVRRLNPSLYRVTPAAPRSCARAEPAKPVRPTPALFGKVQVAAPAEPAVPAESVASAELTVPVELAAPAEVLAEDGVRLRRSHPPAGA